jgi:hypothetical protein
MVTGQTGPYGERGDEAGADALKVLDGLLAPKTPMPFSLDETPHWDETDWRGFDDLFSLHGDMDYLDTSWEEDGLGTGELMEPWQHFTAALPFSEGERYWMIDASRQHWRTGRNLDTSFSEHLVTIETAVMSGGLRQALRGRDLVRRWACWRREAGEFAGQGSLTTALFLLDHIAYELVPDSFSEPGFSSQYPHVAEFDARATHKT